jgi:hypothetical protein
MNVQGRSCLPRRSAAPCAPRCRSMPAPTRCTCSHALPRRRHGTSRLAEADFPPTRLSASRHLVDLLVLVADDAEDLQFFTGAGAGQPQIGLVARPASQASEGRHRRRRRARASLGFATSATSGIGPPPRIASAPLCARSETILAGGKMPVARGKQVFFVVRAYRLPRPRSFLTIFASGGWG